MKITPVLRNNNFGRAFTTAEKAQYQALIEDSKKELGIQDTTAIIFDFNVPSEKGFNTGIGTTFSDSMDKFTDFLKSIASINSVQLQPQGKITQTNTSPYSGTNYAFGEHIIDLKKLTQPQYAYLLSNSDIHNIDKNYTGNNSDREYHTDYEYLIGRDKEGIQQAYLHKAYDNFKLGLKNKQKDIIELNNEFTSFKQENSNWLISNALYEVLSVKYGTSEYKKWEEPDNHLYSKSIADDIRQKRIENIVQENSDSIEFENFKQFLAAKQQKESKEQLNSKGLKLYGDCLIGFSQGEMWANIDCFKDGLYYGGPDPNCPETNCIQTWGLPALDYSELGECETPENISKLGQTGKLLYNKYLNFFKRYDGIRMDAAWQFVTPFVYKEDNGNYEAIAEPELNETIFNIMKAASQNANPNKKLTNNEIMLELVGLSAGKSRELTINKYPHLYTTAYAEYDENPAKFLEKGYKQGMFYVGTGCHDNDSLINMAKDVQKRELHMEGIKNNYQYRNGMADFVAPEYQQQSQEEKTEENFRTSKLAEIFTSAKQFITLPDMFGMKERINISGKIDKNNWSIRIPSDYEKFYFTQLSLGKGLNLPKVLSTAMKMKGNNNSGLIAACNEAAEILRSNGPMTEEAANRAEKKGMLHNKFEYKI